MNQNLKTINSFTRSWVVLICYLLQSNCTVDETKHQLYQKSIDSSVVANHLLKQFSKDDNAKGYYVLEPKMLVGLPNYLEKCWKDTLSSGVELFYIGRFRPLIDRHGPDFLLKYNNEYDVYILENIKPAVVAKYACDKNSLLTSSLNSFLQKSKLLKNQNISESDKIKLIQKLYVATVIQQHYFQYQDPFHISPYYFLNERNICEINSSIDFNKFVEVLSLSVFPSMIFQTLPRDNFDSTFSGEEYVKLTNELIRETRIREDSMINKHWQEKISHLRVQISKIKNEINAPHTYFYYTYPDLRVFKLTIITKGSSYHVLSEQINCKLDYYYGMLLGL
jgi:hypothetical protein